MKTNSVSSRSFLKFLAVCISMLLLIQSIALIGSTTSEMYKEPEQRSKNVEMPSDIPFSPTRVPVVGSPDWISFDSSVDPGTPADVHVTLSDTTGIRVVLDIYGFWDKNITLTNDTYVYDRPEIPNGNYMTIVGKPELPRITKIVEVPHDVDITADVLERSIGFIPAFNLTPMQPAPISIWNTGIDLNYTYVNNTIGNTDVFYPNYEVTLEGWNATEPQVMRGRRLLLLSFYPFQYNPSNNTLKVRSYMEVDLKYSSPAQIEPANSSLHSDAFDTIITNTVLNPKIWDFHKIYDCESPSPLAMAEDVYSSFDDDVAEYLIIVEDDFKSAADRLARWKSRKGVPTLVYTKTEARDASGTIEAFIQDMYEDWTKVPEYILLFGDSEHIPTYYHTKHPDGFFSYKKFPGGPYDRDEKYVATDLYYFTVEGRKDLFPDFFYGRISANTTEEANNIVSKIIEYEKCPPGVGHENFYNDILAASFYEDRDDPHGIEDRGSGFLTFMDEVRMYLSNTDYEFHLNYTTNSPLKDDPQATLLGIFGNEIPYNLEELANFKWIDWEDNNGAISNISANFEDGRFFVICFDHGCSQNMLRRDLGENVYEEFDGWATPRFNTTSASELGNDQALYPFVFSASCNVGWFDGETDAFENTHESLSEILLRQLDGGAIAAVGATRFSYNPLSSYLLEGTIQSFWPSNNDEYDQPLLEFGAALQQGRVYLLTKWGDDAIRQVSLEMYHLFGDPETSLWTKVPTVFSDIAFPAVTQSTRSFSFTIRNESGHLVPDAKVCIQQGRDLYMVQYSNEKGEVEFSLDGLALGEMNITISKQDHIPKIDTILVEASSTALAMDESFSLCSMAGAPDPYVYSQWDPSTWHLKDNRKSYDNPCIKIYNDTGMTTEVNPYELETGEDYRFRVQIWNGGNVTATDVNVTLEFAEFGTGKGWTQIGSYFTTVNPASAPSDPTTHGSQFVDFDWTSSIDGSICLRATVYLASDVNTDNNRGQECLYLSEASSQSLVYFSMENPTQTKDYPYIDLRLVCKDVIVLNASVEDYSSKMLATGDSDTLLLFVDLVDTVDFGEWRLFILEVFYDGQLVGGFEINTTRIDDTTTGTEPTTLTTPSTSTEVPDGTTLMIIIAGAGAVIVVIIIIVISRKKGQ